MKLKTNNSNKTYSLANKYRNPLLINTINPYIRPHILTVSIGNSLIIEARITSIETKDSIDFYVASLYNTL